MIKILLHPLIAPLFVLSFSLAIFLLIGLQTTDSIFLFSNTILEKYTYLAYFCTFFILITVRKDYQTEIEKNSFLLFSFLFFCALLRESGVQHWLTKTDSTAFKLAFFRNPHNPLSEKIISAYVLFVVASVILILLIHYTPKIIKGFLKLNPLYWTVCTFGGTGILCKIADRLPSNIRKVTGNEINPQIHAWIELLEETTESCLPILFALGLIQFHFMYSKKTKKKTNRLK